jgi:hypothetical protein
LPARQLEGSGKFTTQKAEFLIMAYFKKVHPMLQLLMFGGMAMGCLMIFGLVGTMILAKVTGISVADVKRSRINGIIQIHLYLLF